MICRHCGVELPEGTKFCYKCGRDMAAPVVSYTDIPPGTILVCPKCGTKNMRTDRLCRKCDLDLTDAKKAVASGVRQEPEKFKAMCMRCGAENPLDATYCGSCGWTIGATAMPGPSALMPPSTEYVQGWVLALAYLTSFFVPFIGVVIGLIFYTSAANPRSEYRRIGETALVIAIAGTLFWLFMSLMLLVVYEVI